MSRARPYDRATALKAAMALFWRKGYHDTSLKDLEAALDMKPGSIYAAFKSKEALYLDALDHYARDARRQLQEATTTASSPLAALADFLRGFGRSDPENTSPRICMVVKTMLDVPDAEPIGKAAHSHYDDITDEIVSLFRAAQNRKEIAADADPIALARRYQMTLTALRIEAQRAPGDPAITELAESFAADVEALRPAR